MHHKDPLEPHLRMTPNSLAPEDAAVKPTRPGLKVDLYSVSSICPSWVPVCFSRSQGLPLGGSPCRLPILPAIWGWGDPKQTQ